MDLGRRLAFVHRTQDSRLKQEIQKKKNKEQTYCFYH